MTKRQKLRTKDKKLTEEKRTQRGRGAQKEHLKQESDSRDQTVSFRKLLNRLGLWIEYARITPINWVMAAR